jgi:predicted nucleotidyltransferase
MSSPDLSADGDQRLLPDTGLARRFLAERGPAGTLLLCGITGAHHYGFPSADSDIDMKGIHLAPTAELLGLDPPAQTHDRLELFDGVECDLTSHEAMKALNLLLTGNGKRMKNL